MLFFMCLQYEYEKNWRNKCYMYGHVPQAAKPLYIYILTQWGD